MKKSNLIIGVIILVTVVMVAYKSNTSSPVVESDPAVTESVAPVTLRTEVTPEPKIDREKGASEETLDIETTEQQLFNEIESVIKFVNVDVFDIRDIWYPYGETVTTCHLNDEVLVLAEGLPETEAAGWSLVRIGDIEGYIYSDSLSNEPIEVKHETLPPQQQPPQQPPKAEQPTQTQTPPQQPQQPLQTEQPTQTEKIVQSTEESVQSLDEELGIVRGKKEPGREDRLLKDRVDDDRSHDYSEYELH